MLLWPVIAGSAAGGIPAHEAVQLINREKAVVVDVCSAQEFATGHIVGARNIPLTSLEAELPGAVKNKQQPLILVCQSGARSSRAVSQARKLGFEKVYSLAGGLKAWGAANLPLEKT
nr:rhodanese-like domain-containing protein [Curvibacter sp. CHRR-16]